MSVPNPLPAMGRIVHYVDARGEAVPAIIRVTYSNAPGLVDLTAWFGWGCHAAPRVEYSAEHANGSWHWPERQPATAAAAPADEFAVRVSQDGDKWCALVGENLQDGLSGFGDTPADALRGLAGTLERFGMALHAAGLA